MNEGNGTSSRSARTARRADDGAAVAASQAASGGADLDEGEDDGAFSVAVGRRLRAIRRAQGLSLADVEARSEGRWSASAIGAYERGFRNLSVPRLKSLAEFYGVPAGVLLGESASLNPVGGGLVFDLEALRRNMPDSPLQRFVDGIVQMRGDFNGRMLSVRSDDVQAVCAMVDSDPASAFAKLRAMRVIIEQEDGDGDAGDEQARRPDRRAVDPLR